MCARVRSVEPPADERGLEELIVAAAPDAHDDPAGAGSERVEGGPGGSDAHGRRGSGPVRSGSASVRRRPVTAAELGPNGDRVLDLLGRAARLTPAGCRRLEEAAGWRWWSMTPLPGTSVVGARARALAHGRSDRRADAIVALEAAVQTLILASPAARRHGSRLAACIANAGLAVLVRDLVETETFETLYGPWLEVMHH